MQIRILARLSTALQEIALTLLEDQINLYGNFGWTGPLPLYKLNGRVYKVRYDPRPGCHMMNASELERFWKFGGKKIHRPQKYRYFKPNRRRKKWRGQTARKF